MMIPFSRFNSPRSFRMRTVWNTEDVDCEWGDRMPPPMPSSSSARASGSQGSMALRSFGLQVGQTEPGNVTSPLGTSCLKYSRPRYVLLDGLGACPMAAGRATRCGSKELGPGGIGNAGG